MQPPAACQIVKAIATAVVGNYPRVKTLMSRERLFLTGVPATNSYCSGGPVKMKFVFRYQQAGSLMHCKL